MKYNYFKRSEFKCPCCGEEKMHDEVIQKFDKARGIAGISFNVNSGFRCLEQNNKVGGSENSAHCGGYAADIKCNSSRDRNKILKSLLDAGFNRIGIGKTFIHADADPNKPQHVIWVYK